MPHQPKPPSGPRRSSGANNASKRVTLALPDIHGGAPKELAQQLVQQRVEPKHARAAARSSRSQLPAHFDADGDGQIDAAEVNSIVNKGSATKVLQLQLGGLRRVKTHVARKREDKDDRRRMVDLDVAYSFQMEKMEQYKTSVLSQKRSMLTGGGNAHPMSHEEERALATMPTEAMEAALNVSKKVSAVHRLGREQIQSSSGYDRSRDRRGQLTDRSDKGQGWGKMEKYEPMSARIARANGWDSRAIPDQVAGKLKYTLSFVNGMERSQGRPQRALDLVRRELDRDGNPHAQPPGMVNTTMSRDENERAEREAARGPAAARLKNNLRTFNPSAGATVADAMLMHDNYLEWKLDSCPTRPDDQGGGRLVETESSPTADGAPVLSKAETVEAEIAAEAAEKRRRPVPPREQLARQIAVEVGVR